MNYNINCMCPNCGRYMTHFNSFKFGDSYWKCVCGYNTKHRGKVDSKIYDKKDNEK